MEKQFKLNRRFAMVSNFNPRVGFTVITDPGINLNEADELIIHFIINGTVVLKFAPGTPEGYDGNVEIDSVSTNKCSAAASPEQGDKITSGKFSAEIHILIPFTGYPGGRRIKAVAKLENVTFPTTIKV